MHVRAAFHFLIATFGLACVSFAAGCASEKPALPVTSNAETSGGGSPPSSAGQTGEEGNNLLPVGDEVPLGTGLSQITLERTGTRAMSVPLKHIYSEGMDGKPPQIELHYNVQFDGASVSLFLPYDGRAVSHHAGSELVGGLVFREPSTTLGGPDSTWFSTSGEFSIMPSVGAVEILISDLQMSRDFPLSGAAPVASGGGSIRGEVERLCIVHRRETESGIIDGNGTSVWISERDDDWSSEFCSQFAE
jgi:hypothetical protein